MKIYTKTGDDGSTGLFGGRRLAKSDPRVESYGAVDELNAFLGLASQAITSERVSEYVRRIQNELFSLGADLATPMDVTKVSVPRLEEHNVEWMERAIDLLEEELPPIRFFILPGGSEASSRLHVCRTLARRAERAVVSLGEREAINAVDVRYLNRLSDFLFVLARWMNHVQGAEDVRWSLE